MIPENSRKGTCFWWCSGNSIYNLHIHPYDSRNSTNPHFPLILILPPWFHQMQKDQLALHSFDWFPIIVIPFLQARTPGAVQDTKMSNKFISARLIGNLFSFSMMLTGLDEINNQNMYAIMVRETKILSLLWCICMRLFIGMFIVAFHFVFHGWCIVVEI